jgi:hypothetical protein
MASNLDEFEVTITGDVAVLQLQTFCGAAFDLGTREWEHERAAVAIDRLLTGLDGSGLTLPEAVKAAIGDTMIDRAVAVLLASGREFIISRKNQNRFALPNGEVMIQGMEWSMDRDGPVRLRVEAFVARPNR